MRAGEKIRLYLSIAGLIRHDRLFLPSIISDISGNPLFHHTLYNQLKQEYVTARYYLYTGLAQRKAYLSDKGTLQLDTLDYSIYSFNKANIDCPSALLFFAKISYF